MYFQRLFWLFGLHNRALFLVIIINSRYILQVNYKIQIIHSCNYTIRQIRNTQKYSLRDCNLFIIQLTYYKQINICMNLNQFPCTSCTHNTFFSYIYFLTFLFLLKFSSKLFRRIFQSFHSFFIKIDRYLHLNSFFNEIFNTIV